MVADMVAVMGANNKQNKKNSGQHGVGHAGQHGDGQGGRQGDRHGGRQKQNGVDMEYFSCLVEQKKIALSFRMV